VEKQKRKIRAQGGTFLYCPFAGDSGKYRVVKRKEAKVSREGRSSRHAQSSMLTAGKNV